MGLGMMADRPSGGSLFGKMKDELTIHAVWFAQAEALCMGGLSALVSFDRFAGHLRFMLHTPLRKAGEDQ